MKNPKKVYTKEQLYSQIWKDAYMGDENAVNVHISRLRNKIEDNPVTRTMLSSSGESAINWGMENEQFLS